MVAVRVVIYMEQCTESLKHCAQLSAMSATLAITPMARSSTHTHAVSKTIPFTFTIGNPSVTANTKNTGSAVLDVTFADTSAVKASSYNVKYTGGAWQVTRASDGTSVS